MATTKAPSGDKWGKIKVSGTNVNHTIYCNAISGNDYKYNKSYYNIFSMTDYSSQDIDPLIYAFLSDSLRT